MCECCLWVNENEVIVVVLVCIEVWMMFNETKE